MQEILSRLANVYSTYGKDDDNLYHVADVFLTLYYEMKNHLKMEETIFFPRIRHLEKNGFKLVPLDNRHHPYLQTPFIDVEDEDEDAGNIMSDIRKLSIHYSAPEDASEDYQSLYSELQAFETDLHKYIHLENNILLPKALALNKHLHLNAYN
jgi:regulator of cell morphogenesis and NO signaling